MNRTSPVQKPDMSVADLWRRVSVRCGWESGFLWLHALCFTPFYTVVSCNLHGIMAGPRSLCWRVCFRARRNFGNFWCCWKIPKDSESDAFSSLLLWLRIPFGSLRSRRCSSLLTPCMSHRSASGRCAQLYWNFTETYCIYFSSFSLLYTTAGCTGQVWRIYCITICNVGPSDLVFIRIGSAGFFCYL